MQLSKETLTILKNFSSINGSIFFNEGNRISTINTERNVLARALVSENFEKSFGIYDLAEFLNTISLLDSPSLEFQDNNHVILQDRSAKVKYTLAASSMITLAPEEDADLGDEVFNFVLSAEDFEKIRKAANIMDLPDFCIESDGEDVKVVARDRTNPSTNIFSLPVGKFNDKFNFSCKQERLNLLAGTYNVVVFDGAFKFSNAVNSLVYYVAIDDTDD